MLRIKLLYAQRATQGGQVDWRVPV
jgi:hypothetical protein